MMATWKAVARFWMAVVLTAGLVALGNPASVSRAAAASGTPAACKVVNGPHDVLPAKSTSLTTVEQAYRCLLAHYVTGKSTLDDRTLLRGAVASVIDNLPADLVDIAKAVPMNLTGDRDKDWQAFAQWFNTFLGQLQSPDSISGPLAQVSLYGLANGLKDGHTGYLPSQYMKQEIAQLNDGPVPSVGIVITPTAGTIKPPVYITDVFPSTPAAKAGLMPGDTITAIDGASPISNGQPSTGMVNLIIPKSGATVSLTVRRPSTGTSKTVSLTFRTLTPPAVTSRLLSSGIAYVRLYNFTGDAASQVTKALSALAKLSPLKGFVLDLRNNPGGDKDQAVRIVSSLVHGKTIGYTVDGSGHRTPQLTNDKVPLVALPFAVLVDSGSASSSELVASAVKDLHLGQVIGTKTAGEIAEAEFYGLNDGGGLEITEQRVLGPKAEKLEGKGVSPDIDVAASPLDLSSGLDPVIQRAEKALQAGSPGQ